jgi:hypothetical protein
MKRFFACVLILSAAVGSAFSEDTDEKAVSNSDILKSIEEINQRLDTITPKLYAGIGPVALTTLELGITAMPVFMPEIQKINDFMAAQGSFDPINMYFIPFVNGTNPRLFLIGAGNPNLGALFELYRWGQSSKGFLRSSLNPLYPDSLTDSDGDGLVDYYSYIEYAMVGFDMGATYKIDMVEEVFSLTPGLEVGIGSDELRICEWGSIPLSSVFDAPTWRKTFLTVGGSLAVSLFGVEIGGAFDYHFDVTGWQPASGVGKSSASPPLDFNSMNFAVWVNPRDLIRNLTKAK